jgi:hypothetical protein
MKKTISA